jgi:WD40 repeat protein
LIQIIEDSITDVLVTQDSRYLISGSEDCSVKIWDLREKNWEHTFAKPHKSTKFISSHLIESILRASFTATDSPGVLTFGEDMWFKSWAFDQPEFPVTKGRNDAMVKALAQSPDKKYVISGTVSGSLKFWSKNGKIDYSIDPCHLGMFFRGL